MLSNYRQQKEIPQCSTNGLFHSGQYKLLHDSENPLRHISKILLYIIIMMTSCLPSIVKSSLGLVVSLAAVIVLRRPSEEIPVDCSVQPSTSTMHSSLTEKALEFSDTRQNMFISTRVPGVSDSSAMVVSRINVYGSTPWPRGCTFSLVNWKRMTKQPNNIQIKAKKKRSVEIA